MSRWFRFYDAALDDPKVQRLSDKHFRTWVNMLCVASRHEGMLPPIADTAFLLRLPEKETEARINHLIEAGLVDETEQGVTPHNWAGRQFQSDDSTTRVKRFRERKRNVSPTVSETPPDTDTETDIPLASANGQNGEAEDVELYRKGKRVLGSNSGGLIRKLVEAKGGNIALARAAVETASTKADPKEFVAAIVRNTATGPPGKPNLLDVARRVHEQKTAQRATG